MRLISLSHVNDPATTPVFPGDPPFSLEVVATIPEHGFYQQYVRQAEHTGTHWGAPAHFAAGGRTADRLDPSDLFRPAVTIDVRERAARDPDYAATVDDLVDFERRFGRIPDEAAVILWTGWSARWGTPAYAGLDGDGVMHQPGFGVEAVRWLLSSGRLGERGALGTDTFGPDVGRDATYAVSKLLYGARRISLENLTNLDALPPRGAHALVGGPIHRRGSGSTATIWGLIPPAS
jgi:kynurenine formamidase